MLPRSAAVATLALVLQCYYTMAFSLVTFDVDGTLVQGSGQAADSSAHSRAFSHAVSAVFGDDSSVTVPPVAQMLPRELYHGSTDGLILLRLARAALSIEPSASFPKLEIMMKSMYDYIASMEDEEVAQGITPLPGVLDVLTELSKMESDVMCGLVTGNVEGIARRKMRAVGILQTGALHSPSMDQPVWEGSQDIGFLGGFGSDFCSGDIDDPSRNNLDRSQQIYIAADRCRTLLSIKGQKDLRRVVHVGDAPADVLAAKAYAMSAKQRKNHNVCVGMVATATGSYSASQLADLAGDAIPGVWEPIVLKNGIADPEFIVSCGLK